MNQAQERRGRALRSLIEHTIFKAGPSALHISGETTLEDANRMFTDFLTNVQDAAIFESSEDEAVG